MNNYEELNKVAYNQLFKDGALLISGKEECNPMTISWASFGRLWNQPVLTIYVRHSRYSHELLERDGLFTVVFPQDNAMKKVLSYCGSKSGRNYNKKEDLGLSTIPNRGGGIDSLSGNFIHYECRIIGKSEFQGLADFDKSISDRFYPADTDGNVDYHTVYYGSILAAYSTK